MNKTIIININGIIFHIEEVAYEVLQQYMIEVKKHFSSSVDSQEIVSDIESRIAEMFSERVKPNKAVITMQDVEEVCAQMGSVDDFEAGMDPEITNTTTQRKSLFRDPDDKWLGGVCSGLGHYLGIESLWIRFAFLALFLFAGTGLLVYLILWALVPLASTRTDKMHMRGEPQTIQNIKRNFEEDIGDVRRNFNVVGEKMGPGLKKAAAHTENFILVSAKFLIKVIGIILIISFGFAVIATIITCLALLGLIGPSSWQNWEIAHYFEAQYYGPMIVSSFLLTVIPLLLFLILSLKLFINFNFSKYLGFGMLSIWLIAFFAIIYFSTTIAMDFREEATYTEKDTIGLQPAYFLDVNNTRSMQKVDGKSVLFFNPKLNESYNDIRTSIRIYPLDAERTPYIIKKFEAHGATVQAALERAQHIRYDIVLQDSTILFNSHGFIEHELLRDQDIEVEVYLPLGTLIHINTNNRRYFRQIDFNDCLEGSKTGKHHTLTFIMEPTGLRCYTPETQGIESKGRVRQ